MIEGLGLLGQSKKKKLVPADTTGAECEHVFTADSSLHHLPLQRQILWQRRGSFFFALTIGDRINKKRLHTLKRAHWVDEHRNQYFFSQIQLGDFYVALLAVNKQFITSPTAIILFFFLTFFFSQVKNNIANEYVSYKHRWVRTGKSWMNLNPEKQTVLTLICCLTCWCVLCAVVVLVAGGFS